MRRLSMVLQLLLWLCGLAVSGYLYHIHLDALDGSLMANGLCGGDGFFDCEAAATSKWSVFLGFPLAAWGIGFYVAILVLWLMQLRKSASALPVSYLGALAATAVSVFLLGISVLQIGSICPYCVILYGVNVLAFLLLTFWPAEEFSVASAFASILSKEAVISVTVIAIALGAVDIHLARKLAEAPSASDHLVNNEGVPFIGNPEAPVAITIFSDFECPHCARAHKLLGLIEKVYRDNVVIYYRHFPLDNSCNPDRMQGRSLHDNACYAALLSIGAEEQGQFWELSEAFFDALDIAKDQRSHKTYEAIAQRIGVDLARVREDLEAGAYSDRLREDIEIGKKLRVRATPTLFLNDKKFNGVPQDLASIIERELEN